ncbi:hypothetical protein AAG570_002764 [Ranatra chinensis]|uniref:Uncharacterized protein n=1 Tax=Ranatra chinensis TaxID=642074 RepID=A0ABD0Y4U0_9HEMI
MVFLWRLGRDPKKSRRPCSAQLVVDRRGKFFAMGNIGCPVPMILVSSLPYTSDIKYTTGYCDVFYKGDGLMMVVPLGDMSGNVCRLGIEGKEKLRYNEDVISDECLTQGHWSGAAQLIVPRTPDSASSGH